MGTYLSTPHGPWLRDEVTKDIVGVKDNDGSEQFFVFDGSGYPVDVISFDTTPEATPTSTGQLGWNSADGTLDLVMNGGEVRQQIGLEQFYRVKNQTGATLDDGVIVRAVGAVGNSGHISVSRMVGDGSVDPHFILGVITHDIPDGQDGFATNFGLVRGISTNGSAVGETWADGDVLWVHPTIAGAFTKVEPTAPAVKVPIAFVINAHANNGSIFVRIAHGSRVRDLYDVKASSPSQSSILQYQSGTSTWDASTLVTGLKFGDSTNYSEFESDGFYEAFGEALSWRDIDFPLIARTSVANNPTPVAISGNLTAPQWAVNDYLMCEGQELVHAWKEGSTIYWHCHVITNGTEGSDKYLRWEVEYMYATPNGALSSPQTLTSSDIVIPANTPTKTHLIQSIGNFTPSTEKIGTHVYARLKRVATSNGTTYPAPTSNPWCTMLQLHIQCDTLGSRNIGTK